VPTTLAFAVQDKNALLVSSEPLSLSIVLGLLWPAMTIEFTGIPIAREREADQSMDFARSSTARTANCLRELPLFEAAAERSVLPDRGR
jgi:hypothetical protein